MKREESVYILTDPRNGMVRYVGRTTQPKRRCRVHRCNLQGVGTARHKWIAEVKKAGFKPEFEIVEVTEDGVYWERWWIEYFLFLGANLTNYTSGGTHLSFGSSTSFKIGQPSYERIKKVRIKKEPKINIGRFQKGCNGIRAKPVILTELATGEIKHFPSGTHAAKYLGMCQTAISLALNGNYLIKKKKYKVEYEKGTADPGA